MRPGNVKDINERLNRMTAQGAWARFRGFFTGWKVVLLAALVLLLLLVALILPFSYFFTDALWFNHLGFQQLFWKTLAAKAAMFGIFGFFFFLLFYVNLRVARAIPPQQELSLEGSPLKEFVEGAREVWKRVVKWGFLLISIVAGIVAGASWVGQWETVLKFLKHSSFDTADPVFGKDIGYYVFTYPFQRHLVDWLIGSILIVFIVVLVVYVLEGGIRLRWGREMFAPYVLSHLSILLAAVFLLKACSYRLNMYELLFTKDGFVNGIGYTDSTIRIPGLWAMIALSIIMSVALLVNIWRKGWILPAVSVGSMVVVALIMGTIVPALVQTYVVKPAESTKEKKYIAREIAATRAAYGINDIEAKDYVQEGELGVGTLQQDAPTISNIRVWDPLPLLDTNEQLQSIRQYYGFADVDVDRYVVNGTVQQVMISAREMTQKNLPEAAKTWVNSKLVYTHGYGIAMNSSNAVTAEGNPDYIVSDIPPASTAGDVAITRPEVYYGELTDDYVITNTKELEFDYASGSGEEKKTTYEGDGGVRISSLFRKLCFSLRFGDVNLFFSSQLTNDSRIMYYRQIQNRVAKCAPFLKQDSDPYVVLSDDGRLFWMIDCYTATGQYPYSRASGEMGNYVRNSVKAVVNAYDGTVQLFVFDDTDPIIQTYMKIFPDIFSKAEDMPADLGKHVRYPEDLFSIQTNILRTYHMKDPSQFYNKEDQWAIPLENSNGDNANAMRPFYVTMRIPGEETEEMILMLPFTPNNKKNLVSWLCARMDGENYGQMINFKFPSGKLEYGPEQAESLLEQDTTISSQLSLWRQSGSQVIRGNLLVVPVQGTLLYVEPIYLQSTQLKIPQLKRVVLIHDQRVVMAETLEGALAQLFSGEVPQQPPAEGGTAPATELSSRALDLYNMAVGAQQAGDWSRYGELLGELRQVLEEMASGGQ